MQFYYSIIVKKLKTMKRRVGTEMSSSELVTVKDQYKGCIEEHLGVSNRNPLRVGLDGAIPLKNG